MSIGSIFSSVEHFFQNFFVTAEKSVKVFQIIEKDLPKTGPALSDFWQKSLSLAASTSTAFSAKGFNIPADTAEYEAVKAWLLSLKALSVYINEDIHDAETAVKTPVPPIPLPSSVPATNISEAVEPTKSV